MPPTTSPDSTMMAAAATDSRGPDEQQPQPPEVAVGARVLLFGKDKATVRYVGAVHGQAGAWVGIEYDEPAKGKHDGSHGGQRYFDCQHPTAGSLVRLPKFLQAADFGRSLAEAARERYGDSVSAGGGGASVAAGGGNESGSSAAGSPRQGSPQGSPAGGPPEQQQQQEREQQGRRVSTHQMFLSTAGNRRVAVELVTKATDAGRRQSAGGGGRGGGSAVGGAAALVGHGVSSVGDAAELRAMLPSLTELDLSDNLVASWAFLAELAAALPALRALNLSGNRLGLPRLPAPAPAPALPASPLAGLETLVLNGCQISWEQAVAAGLQLPSLRELHLCGNGMASLALPAAAFAAGPLPAADAQQGGGTASAPGSGSSLLLAAFAKLEVLDLENNRLSSWRDDVAPLGALPALRSLLLGGNQLAAVEYTGGFASLRSLLLGGNRLDSWASVDQLDCFPALQEARLSDNPLTAAAPGSARYQCIARVSRLTLLNASAVGAAERWDAEVNYLRLVTDDLAAAGADGAAREAVLAANTRFAALTQKYGELTPAAPKAAAGSALAASMAQLTICHGSKELQKKLPVSLTVGKLKLMLERLLRVRAAQQALLLVPPPDSGSQPDDITDDDSRELRYYDACDGCRLEVSTSDPAARAAALAAAKAAAAASHAQRMEQHEQAIQQFRAVEQRLMA